MLRLFLLLVCGLAAALGLLTVLKAAPWLSWKAAILAGEYGYYVAVVPALAVAVTLFASGWRAGLIRILGLGAVVLLLLPCFRAWFIGRDLPARLRAAFGPPAAPIAGPAFSLDGLFGAAPREVPFRSLIYDGNVSPALGLDFYAAQGGHGRGAPCVVVIHGGGWNDGERHQIASLNWQLAGAGYAVADISYRLAPQSIWPAQRDDVHAALAYLKAHARDLAIDPTRFVVLGRSAGGQIAEAAMYGAPDPSVRGVVALYAPADMLFAYRYGKEDDILKSPSLLRAFLGGTPGTAPEAYHSASGYLLARPGLPPTLMVHGTLDTLVWYRQSERLAARLEENRVPHLLVSLPWATHAVEFHPQGPSGQLTWFALRWFLSAVTK